MVAGKLEVRCPGLYLQGRGFLGLFDQGVCCQVALGLPYLVTEGHLLVGHMVHLLWVRKSPLDVVGALSGAGVMGGCPVVL